MWFSLCWAPVIFSMLINLGGFTEAFICCVKIKSRACLPRFKARSQALVNALKQMTCERGRVKKADWRRGCVIKICRQAGGRGSLLRPRRIFSAQIPTRIFSQHSPLRLNPLTSVSNSWARLIWFSFNFKANYVHNDCSEGIPNYSLYSTSEYKKLNTDFSLSQQSRPDKELHHTSHLV